MSSDSCIASSAAPLSTGELARLLARVQAMPAAADDADRIERVRHFEASARRS